MSNESPAGGMTDTVSALLPCPYPNCRSTYVECHFSRQWMMYQVRCLMCKAKGPVGSTEDEAIGAWHARSPDPLKEAVVVAAQRFVTTLSVTPKDAMENSEQYAVSLLGLVKAVNTELEARALATTDKGGR